MSQEQPIIIIKKKAPAHGHHGGAWKVAYADFVTAMMAFFLVMWILGLNQDTRKSIAAYFSDPTGMMRSKAGGSNPMSVEISSAPRRPNVMTGQDSLLKHKKDREGLSKAKAKLDKMVRESEKFKPFKKNIEIKLTREGLRIELLEDKQALFFESGSKSLRQNTVELLGLIGPVIAKLPNNVIIEGHTDAQPYAGGLGGYSNWELSSDRANAARGVLMPKLREGQVTEISGKGPSRLRNPEDPFHFSNRRISILVTAANYIEGVPVQQADERGLVGFGPAAPNIGGDFMKPAERH